MGERVALITGGTRGIGFGCAEALAREGWKLAVCGVRTEGEARQSLDKLREAARDVLYVQADIAEDDAPDRLVSAVRSRFGRLDLLVNNAGVAPRERKDILEASPESFDRVLRINLRGPYFLTQAAARFMLEAPAAAPVGSTPQSATPQSATPPSAAPPSSTPPSSGKCIIFISSMSATVASINRGEYCISKAGLSMASLLWAARLAETGISVFEVRPGIIRTDMTAGVVEKYDRLLEQGLTLQKRWGTPQDVGKAVAMLARGDLPYSTGQVILVDGGLTVQKV